MKKRNYILIIVSIVVLFIGFFLLSSTGNHTADYWDSAVFDPISMYVAPVVLVLGYTLTGVSILIPAKQ